MHPELGDLDASTIIDTRVPVDTDSAFGGWSAALNRSLSVLGHGALIVTANRILGSRSCGTMDVDRRKIERPGERDAHGALPKRRHAARPLDGHITRSAPGGNKR